MTIEQKENGHYMVTQKFQNGATVYHGADRVELIMDLIKNVYEYHFLNVGGNPSIN